MGAAAAKTVAAVPVSLFAVAALTVAVTSAAMAFVSIAPAVIAVVGYVAAAPTIVVTTVTFIAVRFDVTLPVTVVVSVAADTTVCLVAANVCFSLTGVAAVHFQGSLSPASDIYTHYVLGVLTFIIPLNSIPWCSY